MRAQIPHGPDHLYCPLWRKPMSKCCHTCPWWQQVRGVNPNTGAEVDRWDCAIAFMPLLQMEVASQARQGAAATESFRNEMVALAHDRRAPPQLQAPHKA
jgi:hypothetical protein